MTDVTVTSGTRLDQWLVAARFFKTRALAVTAIKNGRIYINGGRTKPARHITIGDTLTIKKSSDIYFEVTVTQLETKRQSAKIATTFYTETPDSIAKREAMQHQRSLARQLIQFPKNRPDKRERRKLRDIHRQPFD